MTLEEMIQKREEKRLSYELIADKADVELEIVQEVFAGEFKGEKYATLQAIEKVLAEEDRRGVREAVAYHVTKKQGEYTAEDYYALPDECYVELIDGVFYDLTAPGIRHQMIASEIARLLGNHVRKTNY